MTSYESATVKTLRDDIVRWNKENKEKKIKNVWKMNKATLIENHKIVCENMYAEIKKEVSDEIKEDKKKKAKKVNIDPDLDILIRTIDEENKRGWYPYVELKIEPRSPMEMGMSDIEVLMSRCETAQAILNERHKKAVEQREQNQIERKKKAKK
jgi:hypothetical protein